MHTQSMLWLVLSSCVLCPQDGIKNADGTSICTRTRVPNNVAFLAITCAAADCNSVGGSCAACCAAWRVHRVVRGIMTVGTITLQTVIANTALVLEFDAAHVLCAM